MKRLFVVLVVALAVGCATVENRPVEDTSAVWQARQSKLSALKVWDIQGRLSARTPDQGWHASVRWVRDNERHDIDLWGPLGGGHVRLIQDHTGATLQDADRNTYWARDGEQLLFDTTGYWLPLGGLNYWVLGVPVPEFPNQHAIDELGRLRRLQQLGWDIRFLRYRRTGMYEFPSKLFIRRRLDYGDRRSAGEDNVKPTTLEVRLVIKRWTLNR